jgi:hypothetical protein
MALGTWLNVRHGVGNPHVRPGATGFFAWDGGWYRDIAAHTYGGVPREGLRFFPLLPLLGNRLGGSGVAVVSVANVAALAYAEGICRLTSAELSDEAGQRAAWLALLNPAAFVLVLAYAEAPAAALAVWTLYLLRRRQWWWAAALAFLGGLARPIGLLLAIPALLEAVRGRRAARDTLARVVAVAAAPLGCLSYLVWCGVTRGDPWLPFSEQSRADLRGHAAVWPLPALREAVSSALHAGPVGVSVRVLTVPLAVWLLVRCARRLPLSYTAYAAAILVLAIGTPHLASFERYAASAFPLLMAASTFRSRWVWVVAVVPMVALGLLSFVNVYVP